MVMLCCVSMFSCALRATQIRKSTKDQVVISFDTIFPSLPYKKALDLCMQLYGELDELATEISKNGVSNNDKVLISDAMIGKVVCLQGAIYSLIKNPHDVSIDNIEYMIELLARMEVRNNELPNDNAREIILSNILGGIQATLEEAIE